jgi:hypothetical protein
MNKRRLLIKKIGPVFFLILIAVAVRVFVFWLMHPGIHTDSVTFFFLNELDMVRTPGYPIFIELLLSINDLIPITTDYIKLICFGQLFFLGVLNSLLLYRIAFLLTRKRIFSLLMGIFYNFNYFIIGFEFQLLTETLSITLLFTVIVLYLQFFKGKKSVALFAGILMVLLIYTKPTFLLLGMALPILTMVGFLPVAKKKRFLRKVIPLWILFIAVNIIGAGGWAVRNKIKFDYFGISSLMPYQLRYYTNPLFKKYKPSGNEKADRVAEIYAEEFEKRKHSSAAIYNFSLRLKKELGLTDAEIASLFGKVNLKLIRDYPGDYLKRVPASVLSYYRQYSPYWTGGNAQRFLHNRAIIPGLFRSFFLFYKQLFTNLYFLAVLMIAAPLILFFLVHKNRLAFHGWFIIVAVIHYNCFVSTLTTIAGINNLRYRAPVEPLILLVFYAAIFYSGKRIWRIFKPKAVAGKS